MNDIYTYGAYTRKSSESEDKQVQSIPRQKDDIEEIIVKDNLIIHKGIIEETKSAFSPGREGFNSLVKDTQKGIINSWICWHANRLSRNPIDAGMIIYLMDTGKLHHIRTQHRIYHNTPTDKMMLQIEFTMSKKDSDDKSVAVRSGLKKRYKKGLPCGKAPIGYLNDKSQEKGDRGWLVDEGRISKLKLLFNRFLKGNDSISSITEYAQKELSLTTHQSKRQGGILVGKAFVHHVLKNSIYAGFFYSKDEYGRGRTLRVLDKKIPRVITEEEHYRICNILGERATPKTQFHQTPYSGYIFGSDGNYMGADVKYQIICDCKYKFAHRNKERCPKCDLKVINMKNPVNLNYTYYFNIKRRRKGLKTKSVSENKIDEILINFMKEEMSLSDNIYKVCKKYLKEIRDSELEKDKKLLKVYRKEMTLLDGKKSKLKRLFINGIISEDEFKEDLKSLQDNLLIRKTSSENTKIWFDDMNKILDLSLDFEDVIKNGGYKGKKEVLELLCSNLSWNEEILSVAKADWLKVYILGRNEILGKNRVFEPENNVDFKGQNTLLEVSCPTVLGWLNDVRLMRVKRTPSLSNKKYWIRSKDRNTI